MADVGDTSAGFNFPGLGPMGNMVANLAFSPIVGGPSLLNNSLKNLTQMLDEQQIRIATQQARTTDPAAGTPIARMLENVVTAVRGPGITAAERQNIRTEVEDIASILAPTMDATLPFVRGFMQTAGFDADLGMAGQILAPAVFRGMRGLPGMALSSTHGKQAGLIAGELAKQMRLPSGGTNFDFTGGLGPLGVSGVVEFMGRQGLLPAGEDMFSRISQFSKAAGQLTSTLGLPSTQAGQALDLANTALLGGAAGMAPAQLREFAAGLGRAQVMGVNPEQSLARVQAMSTAAAQSGLPAAIGANALPIIGLSEGIQSARGGKPFFGMLTGAQLERSMQASTLRGIQAPFAVAAGGFLQAVNAAGQLAGVDVENLRPSQVLSRLGAGDQLQGIASALETGNITRGVVASVTNRPELARRMSRELGMDETTAGRLLSTQTNRGLELFTQGGPETMLAAQQNQLVNRVALPVIRDLLERRGGVHRGRSAAEASQLFQAFQDFGDAGVTNVREARIAAERSIGQGDLGADIFNSLDAVFSDPRMGKASVSLRDFLGRTRQTQERLGDKGFIRDEAEDAADNAGLSRRIGKLNGPGRVRRITGLPAPGEGEEMSSRLGKLNGPGRVRRLEGPEKPRDTRPDPAENTRPDPVVDQLNNFVKAIEAMGERLNNLPTGGGAAGDSSAVDPSGGGPPAVTFRRETTTANSKQDGAMVSESEAETLEVA